MQLDHNDITPPPRAYNDVTLFNIISYAKTAILNEKIS